jgi:hypothetical protein
MRFRFGLTMADRDRAVVVRLRDAIGAGSIARQVPQRRGWQPTVTLSVSGRKSLREQAIPFFDEHLVAGDKRRQYLDWRRAFTEYEAHFPSSWGAGPSPCARPGCDRPVRGRGLCRAHYYEETGY